MLPALAIALCDDEPALLARTRRLLEEQLTTLPHQIRTFTDADALLRAAAIQPFDLAVLDIQLAQSSGIELARHLLARCPACQVIFLTAHIAYCQDVYDVEHIAFVLKQEMNTRLPPALARACARRDRTLPARTAGRLLVLGEPGRAFQLPEADILYLERRVRTTWVHTLGGTLSTTEKLEALLARLDPVGFCQTHKSFAIHWSFAKRYERDSIRVQDGTVLPISRAYSAAVRQSFLAYTATLHQEEPEAPTLP